ncbi:MAG: helix-turn-helix transcriptional regulator [bacterium]|nr:helix-turn-helix transcriptional regulator [bacterium]
MNYGKALKIVRSARNFSQTDLAKETSLDPSYISLIEQNKRTPSMGTLQKITKILDVPLHLFVLLSSEKNEVKKVSASKRSDIAEILLDLLLSTGK